MCVCSCGWYHDITMIRRWITLLLENARNGRVNKLWSLYFPLLSQDEIIFKFEEREVVFWDGALSDSLRAAHEQSRAVYEQVIRDKIRWSLRGILRKSLIFKQRNGNSVDLLDLFVSNSHLIESRRSSNLTQCIVQIQKELFLHDSSMSAREISHVSISRSIQYSTSNSPPPPKTLHNIKTYMKICHQSKRFNLKFLAHFNAESVFVSICSCTDTRFKQLIGLKTSNNSGDDS
jgi:hypothetical protein